MQIRAQNKWWNMDCSFGDGMDRESERREWTYGVVRSLKGNRSSNVQWNRFALNVVDGVVVVVVEWVGVLFAAEINRFRSSIEGQTRWRSKPINGWNGGVCWGYRLFAGWSHVQWSWLHQNGYSLRDDWFRAKGRSAVCLDMIKIINREWLNDDHHWWPWPQWEIAEKQLGSTISASITDE